MANKPLLTHIPLSQRAILLLAILLSFLLLGAFIWLWYDVQLTKIKYEMEPLATPQSSQQTIKK